MKNEVVKMEQLPMAEIMSLGKAFQESGMFPDIKSAAQAIVKIQAGQEIGVSPFAAMSGIHVILGKPVLGAGIVASKVKGSGKYDYKVAKLTDEVCEIIFYEGKTILGPSVFTIQEARKAGTKNIDKFPKNMLFARAISNGVKFFCPDVFNGPVYVPEEFNTDQKTEEITHEEVKAEVKAEVKTEGKEVTMNDVPTRGERELLFKMVYDTTLNEEEQGKAFEAISVCNNYKQYERIQNRLASLKKTIGDIPNPSQKDINAHLKKAI